ncbi:hypothetical protein BO99DRAFT_414319 [Aspergillus violaceofuscus CBS 115571]|uniref:Uncharacterized protein n=1 Tax=Aspergillus violaceofuscus (strain CBS 115571) TaxID=1450538 RepID=A0A2V5H6S9_ASPV1|nr:hypothetical protein BO99DRAFT_414319 [Aspergillus violaceofuscus CBS 115571]
MDGAGTRGRGGRSTSARGHRVEPDSPPPPPTTPTPQKSQPSQPSNTTDTTPRLISDIKGLLTQIEEQHHSSQPTAPSWVTTARQIIAAGDAAQNDSDPRQFAHQAKIQNLHVQLKGITLEIMGSLARLEQLRKELDEATLEAARGSDNALSRATRLAVEVMVEAHQGDMEGCPVVRKELDGLDDVHDPKDAADPE